MKPHRITSAQHPIVKHLCKLRLNRDYRYEHQRVLIEGIKLVQEVCTQSPAHTIAAVEGLELPEQILTTPDAQLFLMPQHLFDKISGMHTPEGLAAEISMPAPSLFTAAKRVLACDSVNDPGNLGALIRTALALGWDGVFLLNECCDPFNEKALRAAKGATFRMPLAWGRGRTAFDAYRLRPFCPLCGCTGGI